MKTTSITTEVHGEYYKDLAHFEFEYTEGDLKCWLSLSEMIKQAKATHNGVYKLEVFDYRGEF